MALLSTGTGNPIDSFAVSQMSTINLAFETFLPTMSQAAAEKASGDKAVIDAGGGNVSSRAKNQSRLELPRNFSISGK